MKISYFFMVFFFVVPLSVKSNIFEDFVEGAKKWWTAKPEERKQAVYETARQQVSNILNPEYAQEQLKIMYPDKYVQTEIVKPNADYAYDVVTERLAKDVERIKSDIKMNAIKGAGIATAVAVVGAATYGLYRWLTRKGMGGITNDARAIDAKVPPLFDQIDKKITYLDSKKSLSKEDKETANALSLFVASKIRDWTANLANLTDRKQRLEKILEPKSNSHESRK